MNNFEEGQVVIVGTGQAGTVVQIDSQVVVFLANGDIWYGHKGQVRYPQGKEDLDSAPLNVDRFEARDKAPKIKRSRDEDY